MPNTSPQPSFIPREPTFTPRTAHDKKGVAELLVLIAVVLFVASVALAVGVFLYGEYLKKSAVSKLDQLERAEAAFEPSLIRELTRLDDRMGAAAQVLSNHLSPSAFFRMLEQSTIGSIQYTSLDLETAEAQRMKVTMDGIAGSVNAIALQADLFSKGGMVTSPIFSNINREADGVHFVLTALLDPTAINFARLVAFANVNAGTVTQEPTPATESVDPFVGSGEGAGGGDIEL